MCERERASERLPVAAWGRLDNTVVVGARLGRCLGRLLPEQHLSPGCASFTTRFDFKKESPNERPALLVIVKYVVGIFVGRNASYECFCGDQHACS